MYHYETMYGLAMQSKEVKLKRKANKIKTQNSGAGRRGMQEAQWHWL